MGCEIVPMSLLPFAKATEGFLEARTVAKGTRPSTPKTHSHTVKCQSMASAIVTCMWQSKLHVHLHEQLSSSGRAALLLYVLPEAL